MHVERFAPSPNGRLHLGHAFSALLAHDCARAAGGRFLLRIEDIDQGRARPEFEAAILEDLAWLGVSWEEPVLRQSSRMAAYQAALDELAGRGLLYPCFCSRREIQQALDAPQEGDGSDAATGPDGPAYPGTCRALSEDERARRIADGAAYAARLDMRRATPNLGPLSFVELDAGPDGETGEIRVEPDYLVETCGDVALARKDAPTSYHLAVTIDDAHQGVSHVTRGRDLFAATAIHRLLQALLDLPTPFYRHHRLIRDADGRRLAKRDKDQALGALRAEGATPAKLRARLGLPPGAAPTAAPMA